MTVTCFCELYNFQVGILPITYAIPADVTTDRFVISKRFIDERLCSIQYVELNQFTFQQAPTYFKLKSNVIFLSKYCRNCIRYKMIPISYM